MLRIWILKNKNSNKRSLRIQILKIKIIQEEKIEVEDTEFDEKLENPDIDVNIKYILRF